jgi:CRP-like cAMP-binding protein
MAVLLRSPLFARVPEEGVRSLASHLEAVRYPTGEFICSQGDRGDEMFILASGLVEVILKLDDGRVEPLATLDSGDAFGMVSLFAGWLRTASCVSQGDVVVLTLGRPAFSWLIEDSGPAGIALRSAMIRSLIDQLAYANGQLLMLDLKRRREEAGSRSGAVRLNAMFEVYLDKVHARSAEG